MDDQVKPQPEQKRCSYLVRMTRGRRCADVFRLVGAPKPRQWKFANGAAVVGESLSDALEAARAMLGIRDE